MSSENREEFRVWASDNVVYGPVDSGTLMEWVREGRVLADTWVHSQHENAWLRAQQVDMLRGCFEGGVEPGFAKLRPASLAGVTAQELRPFSMFSALSNEELARIISFGDLREAQPGELVIKKGEPGDALFFLLSGQVRARLLVGMEDSTLGLMGAGEIFGEVAMLSSGIRSADVVAEAETRLLRISSEGFRDLMREVPELAAPMLFALSRQMATRFVERNLRMQKELASSFVWR